jgi:predicted DCC family thiol-disulfide oxidoreductase YuxK
MSPETLKIQRAFWEETKKALSVFNPLRDSSPSMQPPSTSNPGPAEETGGIVLFDGHCNLCDRTVDFLIRNDTRGKLRFASLQSASGQRLLAAYGMNTMPESFDSVVFIFETSAYTHSEAALRIAGRLDGMWPLLGLFLLVPRFLRDVAYRFVARNRYEWFGKNHACRMPTPELLQRFLP